MPLNVERHLQLLMICNVIKTSCVCLHHWEQLSCSLSLACPRGLEGGSWEHQQSQNMLNRITKGSDFYLYIYIYKYTYFFFLIKSVFLNKVGGDSAVSWNFILLPTAVVCSQ